MCYLFAVNQPHQALTTADVVTNVAVGQPVNHGAVIHYISAEKHLIVSVVEADAAPRVTGHVEHRQLSVTQVDDITYRQEGGRDGVIFSKIIHTIQLITSGPCASHSQTYIQTKSFCSS